MFLKIFKMSVVACFTLFLCVVFNYAVLQDLSLEPIHKSLSQKPAEPVYLISYADGHDVFIQNQNFLVHSGLNKGIDRFMNYRRADIDTDFVKNHQAVFDNPKGVGL